MKSLLSLTLPRSDRLVGLHLCLLLYSKRHPYPATVSLTQQRHLISCCVVQLGDGRGGTETHEAQAHLCSNSVGSGGPWGGSRRAKHSGLGNHSPSFMHVTNIHVSIPVLDSGHKVIKIAHAFKHAVSLRRQTVQQKVTTQRGKSSDKIPQRILWK